MKSPTKTREADERDRDERDIVKDERDVVVTPMVEPPPGWSNVVGTPPVFPVSPGVDLNQPGFSNNGPPSTGAAAGIPGSWTPAKSDPPNRFQDMNVITAAPATAWTTGQYVTLGDGSLAHWGGAAWTSGKA